jgi:hypothetical protein
VSLGELHGYRREEAVKKIYLRSKMVKKSVVLILGEWRER